MMSAPLKVLLVEDSLSDAVLLEESLTQNNLGQFKFIRTETLREAIAHLSKEPADVMLLDLSLPDVAGPDTFIRARAELPQLPIVVLTGVEDEAIGLEAVRHGIQDYLIKGQAYGRQTARAIHYAIERKRAEMALKQAEAALQHERDQLEARVQERTVELSRANTALQAEIAQRKRAEDAHLQVQRRLAEAQP
jgi:DNA-binding response OmpR family regulator